jgi:quercetin dioxygenase-like cupin family protein
MSVRDREGNLHADLVGLAPVDATPAPGGRLREKLLAGVRAGAQLAGFGERLARFFDLAPEATQRLLREAVEPSSAWEDFSVGGVRLFHLTGGPRVARSDCGLVRIEPGVLFPAHRHQDDEWSFVLAGEAEEDTGVRWAPGDLVHRPAGSVHAFRATGPGPFVFAVVLDGEIELEPS